MLALFLETNADAREWCRRYGPFKKFSGGRGSRDIVTTPDVWAEQLRRQRDRWLDAVLDVKLVAAACERPIYVLLQNAAFGDVGVIDVDAPDDQVPVAAARIPTLIKCSPVLVRREPDADAVLGEVAQADQIAPDDIVITYGGTHFRGTRRPGGARGAKRRCTPEQAGHGDSKQRRRT